MNDLIVTINTRQQGNASPRGAWFYDASKRLPLPKFLTETTMWRNNASHVSLGSKMRSPNLLMALLSLAAFPAPTHAALVERDFLVPGDGLLIYDTVNRREWLDLAVTERVDLAGLAAALAPGGPLEGFSLATIEDVEALASSAGVSWVAGLPMDSNSYDAANQWIDLLQDSRADVLESIRDQIDLLETTPNYYVPTSDGISDDIDRDGHFGPDANEGPNSEDGDTVPNNFDDLIVLPVIWDFLGARYQEGIAVHQMEIESLPPRFGNITVASISNDAFEGQLNRLLFFESADTGGVVLSDEILAHSNLIGPYWLTRTAVPEPSTLVLMLSSSLAVLTRRNRA